MTSKYHPQNKLDIEADIALRYKEPTAISPVFNYKNNPSKVEKDILSDGFAISNDKVLLSILTMSGVYGISRVGLNFSVLNSIIFSSISGVAVFKGFHETIKTNTLNKFYGF